MSDRVGATMPSEPELGRCSRVAPNHISTAASAKDSFTMPANHREPNGDFHSRSHEYGLCMAHPLRTKGFASSEVRIR